MNWGKSIVLAFILFAGFIATLVTVCMRQNVDLVTKEYYKEEIAYQKQLDRLAHTATLAQKPSITLEHDSLLRVSYQDFSQMDEATLYLFRPSDPNMDRRYQLVRTESPSQYVSTAGMPKGLYRAKLSWSMNGREYFMEEQIQL